MAQLTYNDNVIDVLSGHTVLDTLLEHGYKIPNNCRAGACQSCMMQLTKGKVPAQSLQGLKDSHKAKGLFLACSCQPEEDIDICLPDTGQIRVPATVSQIKKLAADVIALTLIPEQPIDYHPGQYMTLWRDNDVGRSYSLANLPQFDGALNFHIKLIANGLFSSWVHNDLCVGDILLVQGPVGDCFYTKGKSEQNLLLAGTGTGIAPLYGIVEDALRQGHKGNIHLFHGALTPSGLYLNDQLSILEKGSEHFNYYPCVLDNSGLNTGVLNTDFVKTGQCSYAKINTGDIGQIILQTNPKLNGWKSFLCGDQTLVKKLRKQIFLAGCSMNDIYADPFIYA